MEKPLTPQTPDHVAPDKAVVEKRVDAIQSGPVKVIFVDTHAKGAPKETIITPKAAPENNPHPSSLELNPSLERGAKIAPVRVVPPAARQTEEPKTSH